MPAALILLNELADRLAAPGDGDEWGAEYTKHDVES